MTDGAYSPEDTVDLPDLTESCCAWPWASRTSRTCSRTSPRPSTPPERGDRHVTAPTDPGGPSSAPPDWWGSAPVGLLLAVRRSWTGSATAPHPRGRPAADPGRRRGAHRHGGTSAHGYHDGSGLRWASQRRSRS
ncbi:hypothetical protein QJS66_15360 [Kocuria rhizophila]|nr:hypothetical protein QJS66_15360 [Kocuria rhizophila]